MILFTLWKNQSKYNIMKIEVIISKPSKNQKWNCFYYEIYLSTVYFYR